MVPNTTDPRWKRALTSESDISTASLPTKILVARLRRQVKEHPTTIQERIGELHAFFEKNMIAQKDIALL